MNNSFHVQLKFSDPKKQLMAVFPVALVSEKCCMVTPFYSTSSCHFFKDQNGNENSEFAIIGAR